MQDIILTPNDPNIDVICVCDDYLLFLKLNTHLGQFIGVAKIKVDFEPLFGILLNSSFLFMGKKGFLYNVVLD